MDRAAITRTEQGYGYFHQLARRQWQKRLDQGLKVVCACARLDCTKHEKPGACPVLIDAQSNWDLGHDEEAGEGYTGPECLPCSRSAGGRTQAARLKARAKPKLPKPPPVLYARICEACDRPFESRSPTARRHRHGGCGVQKDPYIQECERCGKTFGAKRKGTRYCSDTCRNRTNWEARKDATLAARKQRRKLVKA